MEGEIWKDIPGYEGYYQASTLGKIKRLDTYVLFNGVAALRKGGIIKPNNAKGYEVVNLSKDGKLTRCGVHRLVALTFIPNPNNLPQVNHKDENPANNCVDNLEWCDAKYNRNYGTAIERGASKISKGIIQLSKNGDFIEEFVSAQDIQRKKGYNHWLISAVCRGVRKSAYGYLWKFAS